MESLKLEFVINEDVLMPVVKSAASTAIAQMVRRVIDSKMEEYRSHIEQAVDVYLAKRLTDKNIKDMINSELKQQLAERIHELD